MIYDKNGLIHYAVKRFDRKENNEKLHLHTIATMEHLDFRIPAHYSYLSVLNLTDYLTQDYSQIKELFKRMVFNIIGRNQDDHAKNFSFMMDKNGNWRLSPAYDITYTFGTGYTKHHQMTINGKTDDIELKDLYEVGAKIGISEKEVNSIVEEIGNKFLEFKKRAVKLGINKEFVNLISYIVNDKRCINACLEVNDFVPMEVKQ